MAKHKINLTPAILDLTLYSGDGAQFRFTVRNTGGDFVDLAGSMRAQIRTTRDAEDPLVEFDIDMSDAAEGVVLISLTGEKSTLLTPTEEKFTGVWDLEWTPTGKEPITILQGQVECDPDVTRGD